MRLRENVKPKAIAKRFRAKASAAAHAARVTNGLNMVAEGIGPDASGGYYAIAWLRKDQYWAYEGLTERGMLCAPIEQRPTKEKAK